MSSQPQQYTSEQVKTSWSNKPLHIKLGISEAEMNAHLALQARVHDYEERDKEKANELEPEAELDTDSHTSVEEEKLEGKSVVHEDETHSASGQNDRARRTSEKDETVVVMGGGGERDIVVITIRHVQAAATTGEGSTSNGDGKGSEGGHTSGEVWTESPHFLWGP